MSNKSKRPAYRITFSAETEKGLTRPVEIGAAWQRREAEKGMILRFNFIPQNMNNGVTYLQPVMDQEQVNKQNEEPEME